MQNSMKTIISAIKAWTNGKIKNSTADWNQNDENADSYIKNKPNVELLQESIDNAFEQITDVDNKFDDKLASFDTLRIQTMNGSVGGFYGDGDIELIDGKIYTFICNQSAISNSSADAKLKIKGIEYPIYLLFPDGFRKNIDVRNIAGNVLFGSSDIPFTLQYSKGNFYCLNIFYMEDIKKSLVSSLYPELNTESNFVIGAINELNAKHTEGTDALILLSPNGTKFNITVSDDGVLSATKITE